MGSHLVGLDATLAHVSLMNISLGSVHGSACARLDDSRQHDSLGLVLSGYLHVSSNPSFRSYGRSDSGPQVRRVITSDISAAAP